ncbi:PREDICTED: nitrilase homolog 2 isoform X2 [Trachymyrmex cornetzi]|uniref:nitrilase homolog 2 isoform X2 n=1 Tax=Trachymyrmex cornetzi TaxID=471704 RepID=UPI00084F0A4E|nr:PREDICTED: nitrilase homolog 2 isoform X2 [Trachymyrmex cornetzi]
MAEESKKISFGFAKSVKKTILGKQKLHQEKKVDYIECLDDKAIKVIGKEEKKDELVIIPLLESNTWHDRIINKIDASKSKTSNDDMQKVKIKEESQQISNGDLTSIDRSVSLSNIQIKTDSSIESKILTLDEQAVKEIIEDLNATDKNKDDLCDITLSLVKRQNLEGAEESTLEDYEKIPLNVFGSAMLRGMGWKPGEGIGKNPKLVIPIVPELRPIGMGLGADKKALQKQDGKTQKEEEELRIQKGSFIKIIAGKRSNAYGQIEGFDDAGRLIVKMALNGNTISVNECIVQVVTKPEYSKNSKVLTLRLALVQLFVGDDKATNVSRAVSFIERAKQERADIVTLPECFNSPYGTSHFARYAENIPDGETSAALSEAARKNNVYVIGGTIPERNNDKLYNTCTVWGPDGKLVAMHRKMHLFNIDIKGKITFRESDSLSAGNSLTIFEAKGCKIGIGICYDIRFEEMARLYRNKGCQLLVYPAAFNMTTGPLHWSLLQRARANDNQLYVACVSPARGSPPGYVAWGHTQLTNPWGEILGELDAIENMIVSDIDLKIVDEVREQIPVFNQRRTDLYDTIWKKEN